MLVPPIKCQGIKTKIVPAILEAVSGEKYDRWIEPFSGSCSVAFSVLPEHALLCDSNPFLISFYKAIQEGIVTPEKVREALTMEGGILAEKGQEHYYEVRRRFNAEHSPFDFLFLNRACFNGLMRFNRSGDYNVPFCRKPERFAKAYITKIVNQVAAVSKILSEHDFVFECRDFRDTIRSATAEDFLYLDPPYAGLNTDYYATWTDSEEEDLLALLLETHSHFLLSTWAGNSYRRNPRFEEYRRHFQYRTQEHFYHIGGNLENRHAMEEAIVMNYEIAETCAAAGAESAIL